MKCIVVVHSWNSNKKSKKLTEHSIIRRSTVTHAIRCIICTIYTKLFAKHQHCCVLYVSYTLAVLHCTLFTVKINYTNVHRKHKSTYLNHRTRKQVTKRRGKKRYTFCHRNNDIEFLSSHLLSLNWFFHEIAQYLIEYNGRLLLHQIANAFFGPRLPYIGAKVNNNEYNQCHDAKRYSFTQINNKKRIEKREKLRQFL